MVLVLYCWMWFDRYFKELSWCLPTMPLKIQRQRAAHFEGKSVLSDPRNTLIVDSVRSRRANISRNSLKIDLLRPVGQTFEQRDFFLLIILPFQLWKSVFFYCITRFRHGKALTPYWHELRMWPSSLEVCNVRKFYKPVLWRTCERWILLGDFNMAYERCHFNNSSNDYN